MVSFLQRMGSCLADVAEFFVSEVSAMFARAVHTHTAYHTTVVRIPLRTIRRR